MVGLPLWQELVDEKICEPYTSLCSPINEPLFEFSMDTKGGGERRIFVSSFENKIVAPLSAGFSISDKKNCTFLIVMKKILSNLIFKSSSCKRNHYT